MNEMRLRSKLHIPGLPSSLVSRRRLVSKLNDALRCKLTVVCAPAGFGKTTLLSEWAGGLAAGRNRRLPVAWLSLGAKENHLATFWSHLLAALNTIEQLPFPDWIAWDGPPPAHELQKLVDRISAHFNKTLVLILDDYQWIQDPAIHEGLCILLENLPETIHLVISSRVEPPLHLPLLRARDQLVEMRMPDLCFTLSETTTFLREMMGFPLSVEDLETIHTQAEGWVTGLKLAALSMQGCTNLSHFAREFSGANRYICDYLSDQVFNNLAPEVQAFLVDTSFLSRLNGLLCAEVTGNIHSQAVLETLEASGLFTVPLDHDRCWFRYHPLFAGYLSQKLRLHQPARLAERNRAAAAWCEKYHLAAEAIQYYISAGDYDQAARCILGLGRSVYEACETRAIVQWSQCFPRQVLLAHPPLCLCCAWTLFHLGRLQDARPFLELLREGVTNNRETAETNAVEIHLLEASLAGEMDPHRASASLELAFDQMDPGDLWNHCTGLLLRGQLAYQQGEAGTASRCLAAAIRESRVIDHSIVYLAAAHTLVQLRILEGRLREAMIIAAEEEQYLQGHPSFANIGFDQIDQGEILREWNRIPEAAERLARGVRSAERIGAVSSIRDGSIARFRLQRSMGSLERAASCLPQWGPKAVESILVQALQAQANLGLGNLAAVYYWVDTAGLREEGEIPFTMESAYLTLARLRYQQNRLADARRVLDRLMENFHAHNHTSRVIEALILLSLVRKAGGDPAGAAQALCEAVCLAEPEGYLRIFLDEGRNLTQLLAQIANPKHPGLKSETREYVRKILAEGSAVDKRVVSETDTAPGPALVEPLSEREIQVLKLIANGRSYDDIARELVVAISTIQWHIKNIYQKLNVHNGKEAVAIARQLRLLG